MKKDAAWAVRAMSEWLADPVEFGVEPAECEVYYRRALATEAGSEPCFLVRYRMPDGYESLGFVGPTAWSFVDLPLAEIEQIPQRWRQRRMLNLYVGWWYAFAAAQQKKKSKPPLTDTQTVAALQAYLQRKRYLFELRAPKFVEGVTIDGTYYAVVQGERIASEKQRAGGLRETPTPVHVVLNVSTRSKTIQFLGLFEADAPVYGKLPLYHHVGTQLGPFQIVRQIGSLRRLTYRD